MGVSGLIITWILTVVPFTVEGLGVPPAEALIMGEVHFGFPKIRTSVKVPNIRSAVHFSKRLTVTNNLPTTPTLQKLLTQCCPATLLHLEHEGADVQISNPK